MGNNASNDVAYDEGYHILKVQPNSPGSRAGLIAYFDFIVCVNGIVLTKENEGTLQAQLKQNINNPTKLTIYNSKEDETREVTIIPSDSWGGSGLIGVSIRLCSLNDANEHVWHVLEVYPNSPASKAGLQPFTDYIVGTPDLLFSSNQDFYTLVSEHIGQEIKFYVYNLKSDDIRDVKITPNPNWGGDGSLGCNAGYGLLHRIPTKRNKAASIAAGEEFNNSTNQTNQTNNNQQQQQQQQSNPLSNIHVTHVPSILQEPTISQQQQDQINNNTQNIDNLRENNQILTSPTTTDISSTNNVLENSNVNIPSTTTTTTTTTPTTTTPTPQATTTANNNNAEALQQKIAELREAKQLELKQLELQLYKQQQQDQQQLNLNQQEQQLTQNQNQQQDQQISTNDDSTLANIDLLPNNNDLTATPTTPTTPTTTTTTTTNQSDDNLLDLAHIQPVSVESQQDDDNITTSISSNLVLPSSNSTPVLTSTPPSTPILSTPPTTPQKQTTTTSTPPTPLTPSSQSLQDLAEKNRLLQEKLRQLTMN